MPQQKRQSSRGRSSGSGSTAQQAAAARRTASQRKAAANRRGAASKRSGTAQSASKRSAPADDVRPNLQGALEALSRGVVLTRDRLQEVMDDAVRRGRMTPGDANDLVAALLKRGRKQTEDLLSDIEQLLGRAGDDLHRRAGDARRRAIRGTAADRALREVDRARRAAGLGRFPIMNYEDLTAAQVNDRLSDLTPAELRKIRDHERRNANRKSVLNAIERALG